MRPLTWDCACDCGPRSSAKSEAATARQAVAAPAPSWGRCFCGLSSWVRCARARFEPHRACDEEPQFQLILPRLRGIRLHGIRLRGIRLCGIRLHGIRLSGIGLSGVRLRGIRLSGIRLSGI